MYNGNAYIELLPAMPQDSEPQTNGTEQLNSITDKETKQLTHDWNINSTCNIVVTTLVTYQERFISSWF
jgi:hypothetical protein